MKNEHGFIGKRYRKPDLYQMCGTHWEAVYITAAGRVIVTAYPHIMNGQESEEVDFFLVSIQKEDGMERIGWHHKTLKGVMQIVEGFYTEIVKL